MPFQDLSDLVRVHVWHIISHLIHYKYKTYKAFKRFKFHIQVYCPTSNIGLSRRGAHRGPSLASENEDQPWRFPKVHAPFTRIISLYHIKYIQILAIDPPIDSPFSLSFTHNLYPFSPLFPLATPPRSPRSTHLQPVPLLPLAPGEKRGGRVDVEKLSLIE